MKGVRFDKPVLILTGKCGMVRAVVTSSEAADFLLRKWPINSLLSHAARLALMHAINGSGDVVRARLAFEAAAAEVGALVSGEHHADKPSD